MPRATYSCLCLLSTCAAPWIPATCSCLTLEKAVSCVHAKFECRGRRGQHGPQGADGSTEGASSAPSQSHRPASRTTCCPCAGAKSALHHCKMQLRDHQSSGPKDGQIVLLGLGTSLHICLSEAGHVECVAALRTCKSVCARPCLEQHVIEAAWLSRLLAEPLCHDPSCISRCIDLHCCQSSRAWQSSPPLS